MGRRSKRWIGRLWTRVRLGMWRSERRRWCCCDSCRHDALSRSRSRSIAATAELPGCTDAKGSVTRSARSRKRRLCDYLSLGKYPPQKCGRMRLRKMFPTVGGFGRSVVSQGDARPGRRSTFWVKNNDASQANETVVVLAASGLVIVRCWTTMMETESRVSESRSSGRRGAVVRAHRIETTGTTGVGRGATD